MTKRSFTMNALHSGIIGLALVGCIVPKPAGRAAVTTRDVDITRTVYVATPAPLGHVANCPPNPALPVPATGKNLAVYASQMQQVADACRAALGVTSGALP